MLHELDVHREELASQNEELRRANADLMTAKERYAQLYDDAPTAYFTLDHAGLVIEANLTASQLLDAPRSQLFGRNFDDFVAPSVRESFRGFRARVLELGGRQVHHTVLATGSPRLAVRIDGARLCSETASKDQCIVCVTEQSAQRPESVHANGAAQDLNDILSRVLMHAEVALLDLTAPSRARESLAQIVEIVAATQRAADARRATN